MGDAKKAYNQWRETWGSKSGIPAMFLNDLAEAFAAGRSSRDAEIAALRTSEERLRKALEELADHHCGGVCSDNEKERGYTPHSEIMVIVEKALSPDPGGTMGGEAGQ